jgi:hypothetical protein
VKSCETRQFGSAASGCRNPAALIKPSDSHTLAVQLRERRPSRGALKVHLGVVQRSYNRYITGRYLPLSPLYACFYLRHQCLVPPEPWQLELLYSTEIQSITQTCPPQITTDPPKPRTSMNDPPKPRTSMNGEKLRTVQHRRTTVSSISPSNLEPEG